MMRGIYVVGLGYVGQTLAVVLADVGFKVYGIDADSKVIEALKNKTSHIHEKNMIPFIRKHVGKNLIVGIADEIYNNYDADYFIICVSTPIHPETKAPILDTIVSATKEIKAHLKQGDTIILRSTIPVGTTRNVVKPILEETGLIAGKDFYLVHAPERTAQGVALKELRVLPQIISGINEASIDSAMKIFKKITPTILAVSSLEAAEVIKLIDNSYRDLRFAYANELAEFCKKLGLNTFEVIYAANQGYPRNSIAVPSPGVGGICLNKDPHIIAYNARQVGCELKLVETARKINESFPKKVVDLLHEHETRNKKIFIVGFAFKGEPETNDTRDSPTIKLLQHLQTDGSELVGYDPVVENWKIESLGVKPVSTLEEGVKDSDFVIFMTNHSSFTNINANELFSKMKPKGVVFDGWGLFNKNEIENLGIIYKGVGVG